MRRFLLAALALACALISGPALAASAIYNPVNVFPVVGTCGPVNTVCFGGLFSTDTVSRVALGTDANGAPYLGFGAGGSSAQDAFLKRDAANTIACRNGSNACTVRVYDNFTDVSNGDWVDVVWSAGTAFLRTNFNGTGGNHDFTVTSTGSLFLGAGGAATQVWKIANVGGHLLAVTDNSSDIGASGANRPRNMFLAGSATLGASVVAGGNVTGNNIIASPTAGFLFSGSTAIKSPSDGVVELLNNAGTSFTALQFGGTTASFAAIYPTGTTLKFRTADNSADASIQTGAINAVGTIATTGMVQPGATTISGLPTCAAGTKGARWMVTDSNQTATGNFGANVTGTGANVVPVFCDGTNWKVGRADLSPANDNLPPAYREQADRLWSAFG